MKRLIGLVSLALLAVLLLPILFARFNEPERRKFRSTRLADTDFRNVSFRNARHDLKLTGMLFVPDGEGPFAAAVAIPGSGTSRRDNGWYLTLAQYLQENGVVVLLPDKRGSEGSEGNWRTASFEDLATDTIAAVDFLEQQGEIPLTSIGVIGLSQGGHIAPVVATRAPNVSFVVNVVGGAVPMHDALVYEETHNLRQFGVLPGLSDLLAYPAAWSIIEMRQKEFWQAVGNFDPVPYWRRVSVPSLVLYGEDDTNVPSKKSAEILHALANRNIRVKIYPDSGHALESPAGAGDDIFRADALNDIRQFIHAVASRELRAES